MGREFKNLKKTSSNYHVTYIVLNVELSFEKLVKISSESEFAYGFYRKNSDFAIFLHSKIFRDFLKVFLRFLELGTSDFRYLNCFGISRI